MKAMRALPPGRWSLNTGGETLGLSTYPRQRGPVFLAADGGLGGRQDYSDATAADIDTEVKVILEQRHQHVFNLAMCPSCYSKEISMP